MSSNITPHNPSRFKEIHGIKLAPGSAISNLVIERLVQDPVSLEATRFWYNTTDKKFKLSNVDDQGAVIIQEFSSAADLIKAIEAVYSKLASQDADKGTSLIGFAGIKDGETVVAPKGNLTAVLTDVYSKIEQAANNSGTLVEDLASTEANKGSSLIGFTGTTKLNEQGESVPSIAAGTVASAITAVDAKVNTLEKTVGDGRFLGTETVTDQSVASKVTFKKDVVVEGDIIHKGQNLITQGTTVELGDSVILLNREVAADATPAADAGLQVNRGKKGVNDFIIWKESDKKLKGLKITTSEVNGEETETVTLENIVLESNLNAAVSSLNNTITATANSLQEDIDAVLEDVTDLSGELNTYKQDVLSTDSAKGGALVGYANSDIITPAVDETPAVKRKHVVLENKTTVKDTLDVLVTAVEKDANDLIAFQTDLNGTNGLDKVGGGKVGFVASQEELYEVTVSSLKSALALAYSKINELALKAANKTISITSSAKESHTITHNLDSLDLSVSLWIKDGAVWMNHSANMILVDNNTIAINLSTAAEIKVIITKVEEYTRLIGDTVQA